MRKFVIGGNWKLQINSLSQTRQVIQSISEKLSHLNIQDNPAVEVFIAVPYTGISVAETAKKSGSGLQIAAQDVHYLENGPFTGEVSIEVLKEIGVTHILVGHSERRHIFAETDDILNLKLQKILQHNITPVFCIGETATQRERGQVKETLELQLSNGLQGIEKDQLHKIIIAYEPVWAIDNKLLNPEGEIKAATPNEAEATHNLVREWLRVNYDNEVADAITIQYGGSMKPSNAAELLSQPNIDGGLIGGASLSAENFVPIVEHALKLVNQV